MATRQIIFILFLVLSSLIACAPPGPQTPSSPATLPLGIVLMHGKMGPPSYLAETKAGLEAHRYFVSTPEMCWSDRRMYDRAYPDCLFEIDTAIADLRRRGAKSIVVAGHSLGGTAAVAYGASHSGLAGIIGYASADAYWGPPSLLPDIARARNLIVEGKGDILGEFADIRPSGHIMMRTTAAHFLSFVSLSPSETMIANAARLRAPLLFVAGTHDMGTLEYAAKAYAMAPSYPVNRFVRVTADHGGTLSAGMTPVLAWLDGLVRE